MLEKIRDNLNRRFANQNDSRAASNDEVSIAWLISEVDELVDALEYIRDTAKSWEGRSDAPFWNLGDKAAAVLKKHSTQ